jgi:hypothetical protein
MPSFSKTREGMSMAGQEPHGEEVFLLELGPEDPRDPFALRKSVRSLQAQ